MTDPVFFAPSRQLTIGAIAEHLGIEVKENGALIEQVITGVAPAASAGPSDLAFVEGRKHSALLETIGAGAVLVTANMAELAPSGCAVLIVSHPQRAFASIARFLFPAAIEPRPVLGESGISPAAHIHLQAILEDGVTVEAGAVVGAGAAIGSGTVVAPNAIIGPACQIGRDCMIGPGVTLVSTFIGNGVSIMAGAQIGQDGFGYTPGPAGLEKVPQVGRVIIQDNVEIGANTTIDRGTMGDTVIGEGTKIDNQVQVAHNVTIGRHCAIAAQCGLSGSVVLGDGVLLGGAVGIADHITVGEGAQVGARSGLMRDVPPGERWVGAPAMRMKTFFRQQALLRDLADAERTKGGSDE